MDFCWLLGDESRHGWGQEGESRGVALVELSASLVSPGVQVTPSLTQVQEAINKVSKIILSTALGVSQWIRVRKEDVSIGNFYINLLQRPYFSRFVIPK